MRKTLHIIISIAVIALMTAACSSHKNTAKSRFWQSFTAKYNTYFNGSQAYIDGSLEKEKSNKDNFTEQLPLYTVGNKESRTLGKGNFDRTVEKMEKTIKLHSIKAKPEWKKTRRKTDKDREWLSRREYNPFLWKAWLLMGKAQFQKGEFDEAAATFSYMSRLYQTQPAINAIARAWLARCYTELDWMYDAEDVMRNMKRDSIHYKAQSEWDATYANYYLRNGELEKALPYLRKVIKHEKRKTQKARLWFISGQVQAALGQQKPAYKAFQKAIAQNPPYELEFNARIAQTEVMAKGNAKKMIGKLRRMARSDNNKDYLDQVYYAIGNIYLAQRDTANAIAAYEKGNEKATRSGIEKGVLLLRLGGLYWDREKYNDAQRCYGEAIGLLDKDRDDYEELSQRSKVLDELVPHTDAVHLQDSLQELAKMPEKERLEAIDRVIEALKKKEKEERDKQREAEVEQAQQKAGAVGNRNQTTPMQQNNATMKDGQWYFYNPMAVNQGKQAFQRQWGKRENADNWQRINQTVVSLDSDAAEQAMADSLGMYNDSIDAQTADAQADTLANDPHNREYYLAQIPFTEEQVEASNLIIMDGLYNSGVIFKDKLDNLSLAEKQLLRLTTQYPTYAQMDQAWYHLFLLYSRRGDTATADNCLSHLKADYPESDWTILLSDPYFAENQRFGEHIEDSLYAATYDAFKQDRHDVIAANARLSEERFPLGENRPKFLFIDGLSHLNQGDAKGCVDKLKTVVEKYPQSEVAEMAGMIVKGVQEGRQLYGGKFDLDDIWSRRDITLEQDSTKADTLSAERDVPFFFILVYQPDSLDSHIENGRYVDGENQLLYEMARFNFSNFLVRNFDLNIERQPGISRLTISGFLNYDEARQYAHQLYAAKELAPLLKRCRSIIINEHNMDLIGTRYSYKDYDDFYERTFMPLKISNEELLQIPESIEQPEEPEEEDSGQEGNSDNNTADPLFDDLDFF
ncbi:MAG: tetratricopeptide repeat protein [Prevotella sp.]|nr:tetratricopeptide repeat protein [Prevotella sp.]